jgi:hypothetical protein
MPGVFFSSQGLTTFLKPGPNRRGAEDAEKNRAKETAVQGRPSCPDIHAIADTGETITRSPFPGTFVYLRALRVLCASAVHWLGPKRFSNARNQPQRREGSKETREGRLPAVARTELQTLQSATDEFLPRRSYRGTFVLLRLLRVLCAFAVETALGFGFKRFARLLLAVQFSLCTGPAALID